MPNIANKEQKATGNREAFFSDAGGSGFVDNTVGQLLKRSAVTR